jgi:hypothetical protein
MSLRQSLLMLSALASTIVSAAFLIHALPWALSHAGLAEGQKVNATWTPKYGTAHGGGEAAGYWVVQHSQPGFPEVNQQPILVPTGHCRFDFKPERYFSKPNVIVVYSGGARAVIPKCVADMDEFMQWLLALALAAVIVGVKAAQMEKGQYEDYAKDAMVRQSNPYT